MDYWYSLVAPAATPKDVQARLNGAAREVLRAPDVIASFEKAGLIPMTSAADEFIAFVRKESERWAVVVGTAGIKSE